MKLFLWYNLFIGFELYMEGFMLEVLQEKIKSNIIYTEFAYEVKFWNLDDKYLYIFLMINYDEIFKDYEYSFFEEEMLSYFDSLSEIAIENNINIDNNTVYDYLHLIHYNNHKDKKYIFDYNIIKNKYYEMLEQDNNYVKKLTI